MLVWLTLPFYDFCGFRSVAVNSVYKLQFLLHLSTQYTPAEFSGEIFHCYTGVKVSYLFHQKSVGISALNFLRYFYTVNWVWIRPLETCFNYPQRFLYWETAQHGLTLKNISNNNSNSRYNMRF